jgi:small subunit ribosomal protein S21
VILVNVHGGNGEQAIKNLKRKMQRELVFRSMKTARFHEPASVKRLRKAEETRRRVRKLQRSKNLMDGE